jgi:hypothetical protein
VLPGRAGEGERGGIVRLSALRQIHDERERLQTLREALLDDPAWNILPWGVLKLLAHLSRRLHRLEVTA